MKCDVIIAGVGGQGVVAVSTIIAAAAAAAGLTVKQSEEHGMAQRGATVIGHLRLSDRPIHSDLVRRGAADLVLGMEPLEALRHAEFLAPHGRLISTTEPVRNMPDYPEQAMLLARLERLPHARLVDAGRLARDAGVAKGANVVIVGGASNFLPLPAAALVDSIRRLFGGKGPRVVEANVSAFRAGRAALLGEAVSV